MVTKEIKTQQHNKVKSKRGNDGKWNPRSQRKSKCS